MATVSEIWVRVNADIKGLQRGLATSETELKAFSASTKTAAAESTASASKIGSSFSGVSSKLRTLAPAFLAIGGLAVAGIVKGIDATVEWAAEVRSLQRVTGQTAESASALAAAAAQIGIPVNQLTIGFGLLSKNIVNNAANLTKYGIATKDATGNILPFDDVLGAVSDKFATLPKGPEQAAFAMNVFGRSGKALIPILQRGSAGLAELEEHARAAGLVLSQDDVDAAKELSIAQHQLSEAFKGASISIGKAFVPAATELVKVVTAVVEVFTKIPEPVKVAAFAVAALTGVVAALELVGGFFAKTWGTALSALGLTGAAGDEAAGGMAAAGVAAGAATVPTEALVAAIEQLVVTLGGTVGAAGDASAALVGFGTTESGLIVPTEALGAAAVDTEAAIGGGGLLGAIGGISAIAAPAALAIAGLAGVFVAWRSDMAATHAEFESGVAKDLAILSSRRQAPAVAIQRLAQQPLEAPTFSARGEVNDALAVNQAILKARASLDAYNHAQELAAAGGAKLATSISGIVHGLDDATVPAKDVSGLLDSVQVASDKATTGFDHLAKVSGQDFGSIRDSIDKALADPKITVEQLPGVFGAALSTVKQQMKSWHDSIVSNFGGAQAALSQFLGQAAGQGPNKVSFDNLTASLKDTQAQLHTWSQDFATILKGSGDKAKQFLQDMSQNGLDSIGTLEAVAQQPKKIRDAFFAQYNDVNRQTDSIATQITDAFGQAVDRVIAKLKQLIRAVQGFPPIKPKVDDTEFQAFKNDLNTVPRDLYIRVHAQLPPGAGHGIIIHGGGLVKHAGGLIDWSDMVHTPTFHAGGTVTWTHEMGATKLPAVTQTVKRMHTGGLRSDEVPAVLQRGEFVIRKQAVERIGLPALRSMNRMHEGGKVTKLVIERSQNAVRVHEGGTIDRLRSIERTNGVRHLVERFHEGGSVERVRMDRSRTHTIERHHGGGLIRALRPSLTNITRSNAMTYHVGGAVIGGASRVTHLHTGGLTERLRTVERFHDGGVAVVSGTSGTSGSQLSKDDLTDAFRAALRAEREKLYVDRKRFGRDLDQAVITNGSW